MPSEPEWLASISSGTVCTWFYILAILNSIFSVAGVIAVIMLVSGGKIKLSSFLYIFISIIIGFTNAWAIFIVCNRGLHQSEGFGVKTAIAKSIFNAATGNKYAF